MHEFLPQNQDQKSLEISPVGFLWLFVWLPMFACFGCLVENKMSCRFLVLTIENFSESGTLAQTRKKENAMRTLSNLERINLSNAKALRRAREHLRMTKVELAQRMKLSIKSIDRAETGEMPVTEERLGIFLSALGIGMEQFLRAKKGRPLFPPKKREKLVMENIQRRSYRKEITKEVQVLRALRKMRGLSQDQASSVCGYSRPSIGHIENGRIELDRDRINYIVSAYGYGNNEFDRMMKDDVLRDEVLEKCIEKMNSLSEEKLRVIQSLLMAM